MNVSKYLFLFLIILFVGSCDPYEGKNVPPNKAILIAPTNNESNITLPVIFSWDVDNPENEDLSYKLYFSSDTTDNENWSFYSTVEKELEISEGFTSFTIYYWKVEVINEDNLKSVSEIRSFTTGSLGEEPISPKATLIAPNDKTTDIQLPVNFLWEIDNPLNAVLTYKLYLSSDTTSNENWIIKVSNDKSFEYLDSLNSLTTYFWKVETIEADKKSSFSNINSFTTGDLSPVKTIYVDGEVLQLQKATRGLGVNIVILGDGFIKEDLVVGGKYELSAKRAMEAFFLTEPYLTYREYFNFYTVFGESNQRGADHETMTSGLKDTKFNVSYDGTSSSSTYMTTNNNLCWEYSKKAPGCENIDKTLVVVMVNATRMAGYCHFWIQGRAIALCPITPSSSAFNKQFENIILHEAGGHGFSKLGDEYVSHANQSINGTDATAKADKSTLVKGIEGGMFANIDLTNDPEKVKWRELKIKYPDTYKYVRSVEGAFYYSKDVFRPEPNSCMINNIKYYNAPSRMSIVKRIKFLSGESFTLDEFVAKDKLLNFPPQNAVD